MTGNELRWLEQSPAMRARRVHLNQFPCPLLVVPAGPLSNVVGRLLIEHERTEPCPNQNHV